MSEINKPQEEEFKAIDETASESSSNDEKITSSDSSENEENAFSNVNQTKGNEDVTKDANVKKKDDSDKNLPEEEKVLLETKDAIAIKKKDEDEHDQIINEIDDSNAEDAEDDGNKDRHAIPDQEYDKMSLESLVIAFEKLLKNEKVQAIKKQVDAINSEFKTQFQALLEEKKESFLSDGGNEIDFFYASPIQKRFKDAYKSYRGKLNEHYKSLEQNLKQNLADKLEIIEELKGLINVEENINTTYKHFKELQERWRNTGPIPRDKYNNAWNSYHHHVELFYDFLHLNRDLRDLDFKHNLEKKIKIIERAEELAEDDNVMRSFRELQELHKMWKEELGPVGKEHREAIWQRFKTATKIINDKRQVHYQQQDKIYEKNLENKLLIIDSIKEINTQEIKTHSAWQKRIKDIDALRNAFFNAGKVPIKVNEETWANFKDAVRVFNRQKNAFYKGLKKNQYDNLSKKLELIKIAEDNKDSEDFEVTTPLMKKIQSDWKKIGHVPRKDSDKIWKQFKAACNHYFDKLHAKKNAASQEQLDAYNKKSALLDTLDKFKATGKKEADINNVKTIISEWKKMGRVPQDKRYIENKFLKVVDALLTQLKLEKNEVEMIKFESKLDNINTDADSKHLDNERFFIRKKIDEVKGQINQLENNLQFFTNVNDDNPLVKEVHNNIKTHKDALKLWKSKLSKIKDLY